MPEERRKGGAPQKKHERSGHELPQIHLRDHLVQTGDIADSTGVAIGPGAIAAVVNIYEQLPPEQVAVHADFKDYLRVLVVISAPLLHDGRRPTPLDVWREWQNISTGLHRRQDAVMLRRLLPPTWRHLKTALATSRPGQGYQIVHFIGHGSKDGLLLEDELGQGDDVSVDDLVDVFRNSGVDLVVLNVCESEGPGKALVDCGIPAVVATTCLIPDKVAVQLSEQLYAALAAGKTAARALGLAKDVVAREISALGAEIPKLLGDGQLSFPPAQEGQPAILDGEPVACNVPRALRFVGRAEELIAIARQLGKAQIRGVVVSGIGGIGKSALIMEAAYRNAWRFPGGMIWASAKGLEDFGLRDVLHAMDRVLGLGLGKYDEARREQIALEALRMRPALLILDNMETLEEREKRRVTAFLNKLDARAGSKIMLSLSYHDEAGFRGLDAVHPLPLLGLDEDSAVAHLLQEAEEKGVGRLLQAPGDQQRALVRKVGGHPLMLELIVGLRDYTLIQRTVDELPSELEDQPEKLLSSSLACLGQEGRKLLPQLLIFSGSWDYEAMEAVCADAELNLGLARKQLVESSLLHLEEDRYSLHQLVRDYVAAEMPLHAEGRQGLRLKHALHYLKIAGQGADKLGGEDTAEGLSVLDTELENIKAGMEWSRSQDQKQGWELVKWYAFALNKFLDVRGMWQENSEWAQAGLRACERLGDSQAMARTYNNLGLVCQRQGEWPRAIELFEQSLKIGERLGDSQGMARAYNNLALLHADRGEWERAIELHQRSLEIMESLGDTQGIAATYNNLGAVYHSQGQWDRAIELFKQALQIMQRLGDSHGMAQTYGNLGLVYADQGKWQRAIELHEQSLDIHERLGDSHGMAQTCDNLGTLYYRQGEWPPAIELYEQSLEIFQRLGNSHGIAQTYNNLGLVYADQGECERAIELYEQSLEIFHRLGDSHGMRTTYGNLGALYRRQGEWQRAIELYEQSLEIFERLGDSQGMAHSYNALGAVYADHQEWEEAIELLEQSLEVYKRQGDSQGMAAIYGNLGTLYYRQGDWDRAIELYQQSLEIEERLGNRHGMAMTWANMGLVYQGRGKPRQARKLWQKALDVFEAIGGPEAQKVREWLQSLD